MIRQIIDIKGKRFVLVEEAALLRLERQASKAESRLPAYPAEDAKGNRPALDYIRVSIARDIIKERRALGLTQEQLAKLAGLRQETLEQAGIGQTLPDSAHR